VLESKGNETKIIYYLPLYMSTVTLKYSMLFSPLSLSLSPSLMLVREVEKHRGSDGFTSFRERRTATLQGGKPLLVDLDKSSLSPVLALAL